MRYRKLPLIVPAENMQTTSGPFGDLILRAAELEQSGAACCVSIFGVQPWLDVPEMGCSTVSVTNNDPVAGQRQADALATAFWAARRQFDVKLTPVRKALREAMQSDGPVVLSEPSDSTGSGSPGDSTGVLGPLVELCSGYPAAIFLVDAPAVRRAIAAGVDATVRLTVGGTIDRKHSRPVRIVARVRLISDGRWTGRARGYNTGVETCMGRAVVLDVGKIRLLVAERSAMTVDPELFRSHGIEPERMRIVVVKSPNGFRAAYQQIAKKMILVDTPGVSTPKLRTLPYRRVPRPIYPLDARVSFNPQERPMIRRCDDCDLEMIWAIINDGAQAYRGTIPEDRWTEPYMSREKLQHEIDDGVVFWGYEDAGNLLGVMGLQQVRDVTLIRHAYVRTSQPEAGDRSPLAVSFAPAGERPGPDRNMGRCRLGNPLLRAAWLSNGSPPKKRNGFSNNIGRSPNAKSKPQLFWRMQSGGS